MTFALRGHDLFANFGQTIALSRDDSAEGHATVRLVRTAASGR